jgi:hypothetical protein
MIRIKTFAKMNLFKLGLIITLILNFSSTSLLFAQNTYGFEWIKPYQNYYKFPVAKDAIYKIDSLTLVNNGINVQNLNPQKLSLYKNGKEQLIYCSGELDGKFQSNDFILFHGQKNTGELDKELYTSNDEQAQSFSSLFSDTAWYFLCINADTSNQIPLRYNLTSDTSFSSFLPEQNYLSSKILTFQEEYYRGAFLPASTKYYVSDYAAAEGWISYLIGLNQSREVQINLPDITNILEGNLELKIVGSSDFFLDNPDAPNHHVQVLIGNSPNPTFVIADTTYRGYGERLIIKNIPSIFMNSVLYVKVQVVNDLAVNSDLNGISYIKIDYNTGQSISQTFKTFQLYKSGLSKKLIQFTGFNGTGAFILDKFNKQLINCSLQGLILKALALNSDELIFCDNNTFEVPGTLEKVDFFIPNPNQNYQYLIVSNKALEPAAAAYRDYRSNQYKTLLVYADQLANTYFYGHHHPLSIKRFSKHLFEMQAVDPAFLLLLGRGYQNNLIRTSPENYKLNLVPAIGEPSSDNLYTAGFDNNQGVPAIPTGRIPAQSNQDVFNYLEKIQALENNPDTIAEWRKNFLHLSGGEDYLSEQIPFTNRVNYLKGIVAQKPTGANVFSYHKNVTKPTQDDIRERLIKIQNDGVNMMTFLGHGSLTVLDMDFGSIGSLIENNKPSFYYFNGCSIGNANDVDPGGTGLVYGKDYICAARKGAIGWLAHSNLTLTGYLYNQMDNFYLAMNGANYGRPVGEILKTALIESTSSNDLYARCHALQLLLQGDPAFKLYSPSKPDFSLNSNAIFVNPANATAQLDSFQLAIVVNNIAKAVSDSIEIKIRRVLPDNSVQDFSIFKVNSPYFRDTIYYWIRPISKTDAGLNKFFVDINPNKVVEEIQYTNNSIQFDFFLPGSGITLLYPYPYSIVNVDSIVCYAQNNNIFSDKIEYLFELDTSFAFNKSSSFFKESGPISQNGLASFQFKLNSKDTQVYFWRVKMNISEDKGGIWQIGSFTHIPNGPSGWRQSLYSQVKDVSDTRFVLFNDSLKSTEFTNNELTLGIENRRWDHRRMGVVIPYLLNALVGNCMAQGTVVLVFEPFQVDMPYELPNYPFNCSFIQANKTDRSFRYYTFNTNYVEGERELRRLVDSVPDGFFVAMFSRYSTNIHNWELETRNMFSKIGSVKVGQVASRNTAWAVIGMKNGALGTASEDTVQNNELEGLTSLPPQSNEPQDEKYLRIKKSFLLKWFEGDFTSKAIGPAKQYGSLRLNLYDKDIVQSGRWWAEIIGVNISGFDTALMKNINTEFTDLANIDATKYPFLKLKLHFVDSLNRTPHQIKLWQISYVEAPELVIDPSFSYEFKSDKLDKGDSIRIKIPVRNISASDVDSFLINWEVKNDSRIITYNSNTSLNNLAAKSFKVLEKSISTSAMEGNQQFKLNINSTKRISEFNFNNNIAIRDLSIKADKLNPLLDVSFDGQRIINGEIVSPQPIIRISSTDANKFLLQEDTSTFNLYLRKPRAFEFDQIPMNSPEIKFIPANQNNNTATIEYKPSKFIDGLYTLKVQAKDASGNFAGNTEYQIDFSVINKSSITYFYPYPNPFTSSMRFVFTLTGSKIPDQLLVRIMSIDGRIVKEVRKEEFGNIRIGNNVSEWAWDGTDNFGDKLANGVYFYQVFSKIDNSEIEHRTAKSKDEDKFFIKNTGKIYLMR